MRKINYIVCHCTATDQDATVKAIKNFWKNNLGWKNPGYHFIIEKNGIIHNLQPIDKLSNGVRGYNANSIHVAYIGGRLIDDRTPQQKASMRSVVKVMQSMFPDAKVQGHRDFPNVSKACPRFDAKNEF